MIFLTLGTYPLPFDRLVVAIDNGIRDGWVKEEVFAQIGMSGYKPQNMEYVDILEKGTFDSYFEKASCIISHAGIGTIIMALDNGKPLLAMPRLKKFGEVVNDHQVATAKKFEHLGHMLVAYNEEDLPEKIKVLKDFVPREREASPVAVAERISSFLHQMK